VEENELDFKHLSSMDQFAAFLLKSQQQYQPSNNSDNHSEGKEERLDTDNQVQIMEPPTQSDYYYEEEPEQQDYVNQDDTSEN